MIEIKKSVNGRTQKMTVVDGFGKKITAMRWRITATKHCPWLVSEGEGLLPQNPIKRGIMLSHIWRLEKI